MSPFSKDQMKNSGPLSIVFEGMFLYYLNFYNWLILLANHFAKNSAVKS